MIGGKEKCQFKGLYDVGKNAVIISLEKMKGNVSTDKEKGAC